MVLGSGITAPYSWMSWCARQYQSAHRRSGSSWLLQLCRGIVLGLAAISTVGIRRYHTRESAMVTFPPWSPNPSPPASAPSALPRLDSSTLARKLERNGLTTTSVNSRMCLLGGPAQKMSFFQMVTKPFLSVLIYSTRCEYDILKVLLKKNDQNPPVGSVKHRSRDFYGLSCWILMVFTVVCHLWWLDWGALLILSVLIHSNRFDYDILIVLI